MIVVFFKRRSQNFFIQQHRGVLGVKILGEGGG